MSEEKEIEVRPEQKDEKLSNDRMTITVDLERMFDPKRKKNNLMMTMDAIIMSDQDDKEVGMVLHGIPCHSVIRDKETGEDWILNYGELFNAYVNARANFGKGDESSKDEKDIPNSSDLVVN